jgi:hypothetical protein
MALSRGTESQCWQDSLAWYLLTGDAIRETMSKDFGTHSTALTDMVEVLGVAGRAAYVMSQIEKWTAVENRDVDAQMYGQGKAEVRYQPKGVIGNIVRKSSMFSVQGDR